MRLNFEREASSFEGIFGSSFFNTVGPSLVIGLLLHSFDFLSLFIEQLLYTALCLKGVYNMRSFEKLRMGASSAPKVIRVTVFATLIATFFSLLLHQLFIQFFRIPSLYQILSLSTWGIQKLFVWQFVSYLLIEPLPNGIHFALLLCIFFKFYLLWTFGSSLVQLKGKHHFLALYFGGGIFVGLLFYLFQCAVQSCFPLAGATPAIYILLISWTFLFPTANFMLFMMLPMRAHHLVFGMLGVTLFLDFCKGHFFGCLVTVSSLLFGYLYALLAWEIPGPFLRLRRIDNVLIQLKRKYLILPHRSHSVKKGKIYDFQTGRIVVEDKVFAKEYPNKKYCPWERILTWCKRWTPRLFPRSKTDD